MKNNTQNNGIHRLKEQSSTSRTQNKLKKNQMAMNLTKKKK
jgi:hypothetical protein